MLHQKIAILTVIALSFGLVGSAYAHTHQVIGKYEVEVGWKNEPPVVGKENAITVMITPAPTNETPPAHDNMTNDQAMPEGANQTMNMPDQNAAVPAEEEVRTDGIPGLASSLEVSLTLDGKKTNLELVEDETTPGLYIGMYTPTEAGSPTIHVFGKINDDTIEASFHPEVIENVIMTPMQQQNDGIEPKAVVCHDDLILLGKKSTNTAICVTQKTADVLVARDWAFHFE